jgi:4a-hydroxytetrahydrobiopterin dehydratase
LQPGAIGGTLRRNSEPQDRTMTDLLSPDARTAALPALGETGWGALPDRDAIRKIWKFRSFSEAWGFMSRAALVAEKLNHHPEWTNVYNTVDVTLTTHEAGGLSELDIRMAERFDKLAGATEVQRDHSEPVTCLCEIHARTKGAPKAP